MSFSESDELKKYPDKYFEEELIHQKETDHRSSSSMFCNNCNNDFNRLQLYFNILAVLFLLSLLGGIFLHIDRKTIIEQNSKILSEYKHHQRLYNNHIDNTIGYIQKMIDLLIKTQGRLSNVKFDVSFDHNFVPDVIML